MSNSVDKKQFDGVNSFEYLASSIYLLGLNDNANDDLKYDLIQCQDGVICGMKLMSRLLKNVANDKSEFDEYGDAATLNDIGVYLESTAKLLSGLSIAITETELHGKTRK